MAETPYTPDDLVAAVDDLAMLPYFPSESRGSVIALLARMCPHKRALRWLVGEMINHVGKWQGPAELRGLLCTRFDPADGIDQWCSLPGYRAVDYEMKAIEEHDQRKTQETLGGYVAEEPNRLMKQLVSRSKSVPTAIEIPGATQ